MAAISGHLKTVQYLVAEINPGIPADAKDGAALIYAAWNGYLNIAEYLLSNSVFKESQCDNAISKAENPDIIVTLEKYKEKFFK